MHSTDDNYRNSAGNSAGNSAASAGNSAGNSAASAGNSAASAGNSAGNSGGGDSIDNSGNRDAREARASDNIANGGVKSSIFGFSGGGNRNDKSQERSASAEKLSDEERRERNRLRMQAARARARERDDSNGGNGDNRENVADGENDGETSQEETKRVYENPPRRVDFKKILEETDVDDSGLPKGVIAGAFKSLFALPAMAGLGDWWRLSEKDARDLADGLSNCLATMPKTSRVKYDKYLKNYFPWLMFAGGLGLLIEERLSLTLQAKREAEEYANANQNGVFEQGNFAPDDPRVYPDNSRPATAGGDRKATINTLFRRVGNARF